MVTQFQAPSISSEIYEYCIIWRITWPWRWGWRELSQVSIPPTPSTSIATNIHAHVYPQTPDILPFLEYVGIACDRIVQVDMRLWVCADCYSRLGPLRLLLSVVLRCCYHSASWWCGYAVRRTVRRWGPFRVQAAFVLPPPYTHFFDIASGQFYMERIFALVSLVRSSPVHPISGHLIRP